MLTDKQHLQALSDHDLIRRARTAWKALGEPSATIEYPDRGEHGVLYLHGTATGVHLHPVGLAAHVEVLILALPALLRHLQRTEDEACALPGGADTGGDLPLAPAQQGVRGAS